MSPTLADALQDCLQRLEAGEDVDWVLARHGGLEPQLRPLLQVATVVRLRRPKPAPAFRAGLQVHLAGLGRSGRAGRRIWRPAMVRLAGVLLAILMVLSGMAVASADSRPGDVLYPIRRGMEQARAAAAGVAAPVVRALTTTPERTDARAVETAAAATAPRPTTSVAAVAPATRPQAAASRRQTRRAGRVAEEVPAATAASPADGPAGPVAAAGSQEVQRAAGAAEATAHARATAPTAAAEATVRAVSLATARVAVPTPRPSATVASAKPVVTGGPPSPTPPAWLVATVVTPPTAGDPETRIAVGGVVRGRVMREDGRPMALLVAAYPVSSDTGEPSPFTRNWVRTRGDGSYQLDDLRPGLYKIAATENGWFGRRRWHPGTWSVREARMVSVGERSLVDGIDIRYDTHRRNHGP